MRVKITAVALSLAAGWVGLVVYDLVRITARYGFLNWQLGAMALIFFLAFIAAFIAKLTQV